MNLHHITTEYLGDGVYIQSGSYPSEIILTTGCHIGTPEHPCDQTPDNVIVLDPSTARSLFNYLSAVFAPTK